MSEEKERKRDVADRKYLLTRQEAIRHAVASVTQVFPDFSFTLTDAKVGGVCVRITMYTQPRRSRPVVRTSFQAGKLPAVVGGLTAEDLPVLDLLVQKVYELGLHPLPLPDRDHQIGQGFMHVLVYRDVTRAPEYQTGPAD